MGRAHLYINRANYLEWALPILDNLLKDPRVDPSTRSNKCIKLASEWGHTEAVKLLLRDPRVNPSHDDNRAIRMASKNMSVGVIRVLLGDPRVNPTADDNYSLRFLAYNGCFDAVKILGRDPRISLPARKRAGKIALKKGHVEISDFLAQCCS